MRTTRSRSGSTNTSTATACVSSNGPRNFRACCQRTPGGSVSPTNRMALALSKQMRDRTENGDSMITLAIDTSTLHGSVALLREDELLFEERFSADRSHSASLFT